MTYDPNRDLKAPEDVSPARRPGEGPPDDRSGLMVMVAALIIVTGFGLLYMYGIERFGQTAQRDNATTGVSEQER